MDENDFEGTLILEKLVALDLLEDFFEAIDSDDVKEVVKILKQAEIDDETIEEVLNQIEEASDE